jgi:biopolymer transport protein ExbB
MTHSFSFLRAPLVIRAALALAVCLGSVAHAEGDFQHGRKLVFDTTQTGSKLDAPVSQLPVLVRLHSGNFTFAEAKPDGSDLRFFAGDGKTPLNYTIEKFDAVNEIALAWVQVPKINPDIKTESIWVRWGNEGAASTQDSKATFDASHLLVLNFDTPEAVKDSSANALVPKESTAKPLENGPIGGAANFDGGSRIVLQGPALQLKASEGLTLSAWVNPVAAEEGGLFAVANGALSVVLDAAGKVQLSAGKAQLLSSLALKPGVWQHIAIIAAAGKAQIYLDGVQVADGALVWSDLAGDVVVGEAFRGGIDAVMLSNTARSVDYVKALAFTQMADSPMVAFDEGEVAAEGEINYFAILLGAVTIDGWVVIAILGVMAVVSLWVMIEKTLTLSRTEKANAEFLELFKNKSQALLDPADLEYAAAQRNAAFKNSSIYTLYAVGMNEVEQRFKAQKAAGKSPHITAAALESIRAALDATIVRAGQKFNSGIVLLTISISGGPFLGLLGTVVGVMITFAAIAAAGDVNVNAIAPGIAAALVATVAGLAVAIPALFAYNWFAIKIKNIAADTTVFADEFLTKSAELHGQHAVLDA